MTSAFASSVSGGRQFDDVLKTLALRLSDTALRTALAPITRGLASGISQLFSGLFGGAGAAAVRGCRRRDQAVRCGRRDRDAYLFPAVFGTWTCGGSGAGGDHAVVARGRRTVSGIATIDRGGAGQVVVNISMPYAASFRGAEVYLTGQIARAVARGQRGLRGISRGALACEPE